MGVLAIVQARMGSSRLPGKVLKTVEDKALLKYQMDNLRRSKQIDKIVIATTINKKDDEIVSFCELNDYMYYRGSELDVLSRYFNTWKYFYGDIIVRLTSDCPLIDVNVVDDIIQFYKENEFDYVSNTIKRTYPRGLDVEIFSNKSLEKAFSEAILERDREHVTPYMYTNPQLFKTGVYKGDIDYSRHRWTVDTEEDFELISNLIMELNKRKIECNLNNLIQILNDNSEWAQINAHVEQKEL